MLHQTQLLYILPLIIKDIIRKQAVNDKLQGSAATYLRCGGVDYYQINKDLLLTLDSKFL